MRADNYWPEYDCADGDLDRMVFTVKSRTQNFAIDITAQATILPSAPAGPVQQLRVETRYLRLSAPVALGDRIDGWRVCWLGGWDRGKVVFVVMVERVTRAPGPQ